MQLDFNLSYDGPILQPNMLHYIRRQVRFESPFIMPRNSSSRKRNGSTSNAQALERDDNGRDDIDIDISTTNDENSTSIVDRDACIDPDTNADATADTFAAETEPGTYAALSCDHDSIENEVGGVIDADSDSNTNDDAEVGLNRSSAEAALSSSKSIDSNIDDEDAGSEVTKTNETTVTKKETESESKSISELSGTLPNVAVEEATPTDSPAVIDDSNDLSSSSTDTHDVGTVENSDANNLIEDVDHEDRGEGTSADEFLEQEEQWDLSHIFTIDQLNLQQDDADETKRPQMCMTKSCPLVACCTYISTLDKENPWHSCLDCQEADYGGWPETVAEIPVTFLTVEHKNAMIEKCTGQYSPPMPHIPINEHGDFEKSEDDVSDNGNSLDASSPTPTPTLASHNESPKSKPDQTEHNMKSSSTTPPPPGTTTTKTKGKKKKTKSSLLVTPSPVPPSGSANGGKSRARVVSAKLNPMYEKWQKECIKMGGNGKLVVNKSEIKKMIFELCKDSFLPMNITQIYNKMKGAVPTVLVKTCLDDMALDHFNPSNQFADSDDEDARDCKGDRKTKGDSAPKDEFAGSLKLKSGRNANTSLYFVDYSKLYNNGNGLLPQDRNDLMCSLEKAKGELDSILSNEKSMNAETKTLLSQPINVDIVHLLEKSEADNGAMRQEVEACEEFKDNAKHCKTLKKRVDIMVAQWRKRKRTSLEFLDMMEEATDGTISTKKCLSGDGQMDIDSDEAVIKGQIAYVKQKRSRTSMFRRRPGNKKQKTHGITKGFVADESFVGVELKPGGVTRIFMDE